MKIRKRTMAALAAIVMAVSSVPLTAAPLSVSADGDFTKSAANTTLGTSGIGAPSSDTSNTAWTGNYVYYGKYENDPVKYRVLAPSTTAFSDGDTETMFLDCDKTLYNAMFSNNNSTVWANSSVKSGLSGDNFFNNNGVFTSLEKAAIAESKTSIEEGSTCNLKHTNLDTSGEKVFLLDVTEANNSAYGYSSVDARKKSGTGPRGWWLRSPYITIPFPYYGAGFVTRDEGSISDADVDSGNLGVSPAFNVNLSSVIFSSDISETNANNGKSYKLTLKDENTSIIVTDGQSVTKSGNTVTVPYTVTDSNANDGIKADKVSVLMTDKAYTDPSATIKYYAPLTGDYSASGSGTFVMPTDYDKSDPTWNVYILAEDVNDENVTDYASAPVKITVPKHEHNLTSYTANGDTITATCSADDCPLTNKTATLKIAPSATGGYGARTTMPAKASSLSIPATVQIGAKPFRPRKAPIRHEL